MALTAFRIKSLKPARRPYKERDEKGLYLHILPTGTRIWRMDYRFAGKRRTLTIGPVDLIPLSEARERRDTARKHLLDGTDPAEVKARTKGQETDIPENAFRHMAKAWHDLRKKSLAPKYAYDQWTRLERLIFPHIGDTAITDLKPKDALRIFNRLEAKGTVETAHRSIQLIGQVFRLGRHPWPCGERYHP